MGEVLKTLFTIGHSNHDWPVFLELLTRHGISAVADVRSQPTCRLPQYDRSELSANLAARGIEYVFLGRELGARRTERECYEDGQAVYEQVAHLPAFRWGLERIQKGLKQHAIALMCAEKEPLDCHRTILICRHLRDLGITIQHILADGEVENHADTERRLLRLTDERPTLFEPNLSERDLIERAYETRGRQIAYRQTDKESVSP